MAFSAIFLYYFHFAENSMKINFAIFIGNVGKIRLLPIRTWHNFTLFTKHPLEDILDADVSSLHCLVFALIMTAFSSVKIKILSTS